MCSGECQVINREWVRRERSGRVAKREKRYVCEVSDEERFCDWVIFAVVI